MSRAAIDVGGTFTDCLVMDDEGNLAAFKASTTPHDATQGLLDALEKAARTRGKTLQAFLPELDLIIHGTTLATNAVLTGRGAKVGMITTRGFRDVIEARRGYKNIRTSMYDLFIPPYKPLVPRSRRVPVTERMLPDGTALVALDEPDARAAIERLADEGVEAVAICLLHSYANGAHEARVEELCRERFDGGVYLTTSHDVLPIWGEYERFSTATVSAYIGPIVSRYLARLEQRLHELGFRGSLLIVQSDGLVQSAAASSKRAVELVGSGPAAAPTGALQWGRSLGFENLISVDMGGTSFDVCLVQQGVVPTTTEGWVGDERVAIQLVDVHSVGAGGGSIAWLDSVGLLRVGPQSAGADPGPACYRRGGTQPTVTDADVVLGFVPTDYFLGGEIALDGELARQAVRQVAEPLGLDETRAAEAIFTTVNSFMADQITEISTKRGLDIRDYALVVGGGAGAVHAVHIADSLDIPTVLIPRYSALYSAYGMFAMDIGREYVRSYIVRASDVDLAHLGKLYGEMEQQAVEELSASGVDPSQIAFERTADMRYAGQFHEVDVMLPSIPRTADDVESAAAAFHARHHEVYSFELPFRPAEFIFFRLKATVPRQEFHLPGVQVGRPDPSAAFKRRRPCFFAGEWVDTPCYEGDLLQAGNVVEGPAILEERTTTVVIPAHFTCTVDPARTYVLRRRE